VGDFIFPASNLRQGQMLFVICLWEDFVHGVGMGKILEVPDGATKVEIWLDPSDLKRLEKFRGELSRDTFIKVILRILDSGAVSDIPDCILENSRKTKSRRRNGASS
jgi:hypothetical protein